MLSISVHFGVWQKVDLMDSSLPLALYSVQQPPYSVCLPLHDGAQISRDDKLCKVADKQGPHRE